MTKLSETQLVILSAAAQRDDGAVLPLPESLKIKGGAVQKVLASLERKGLIARTGTPRGDDPPPLRITRAGLDAIGVEPEDGPEAPDPALSDAPFVEVTGAPQAGTEAQEPAPAGQEPKASESAPDARPARTRTPRTGTKQPR